MKANIAWVNRARGQPLKGNALSHAERSGDGAPPPAATKTTYGKTRAYQLAREAKNDLEKRLGKMEDKQKTEMIASIIKEYPEAVRLAAERAKMFSEARQEVVDEIEETWTSHLGSAIRSICKLSEKAYQRLIQLLCQQATWVNGKLKYVAGFLPCGVKRPQLCAHASVNKTNKARKKLVEELNITTSHLSDLLGDTSNAPGKCKKGHKKASQTNCRRPVKDIVT